MARVPAGGGATEQRGDDRVTGTDAREAWVETTASPPGDEAAARRRRRWPWLLALLAVTVGLTAVLSVGFGRDPRVVASTLMDRPAPALSGPTLDDGSFDLADYRGQVVVVNFWASWCVACRQEHPQLVSAALALEQYGVQFVGVDTQDTVEAANAFMAEMGDDGTYPSVLDPDGRKAVEWGLFGVPETFVIDPSGRIRAKAVGAVTEEWLVGTVGTLLTEAAPGAGAGPTP